jgi:hypothetical protein
MTDPATPDPVAAELADLSFTLGAVVVSPESFDPAALMNRVMRAIDALSAALAPHRRSPFPATWGEHRGRHYCTGCTTDVDHHVLYVDWPCPEVQAVRAALHVTEGDPTP